MNESILVVGSEGFIGTELVKALELDNFQVFRFSRSLGNDLVKEGVFSPFEAQGITTVIHVAGRSFIPDSWKSPLDFYQVNTMGTERALEFCRKEGARMVYVSTYVYGRPQYLPIDEKHPVAPLNPYTHSR